MNCEAVDDSVSEGGGHTMGEDRAGCVQGYLIDEAPTGWVTIQRAGWKGEEAINTIPRRE